MQSLSEISSSFPVDFWLKSEGASQKINSKDQLQNEFHDLFDLASFNKISLNWISNQLRIFFSNKISYLHLTPHHTVATSVGTPIEPAPPQTIPKSSAPSKLFTSRCFDFHLGFHLDFLVYEMNSQTS
jgi:hypothetical protein